MKAVGEGGALDELSEVKQPKPAGPWGAAWSVCWGILHTEWYGARQ